MSNFFKKTALTAAIRSFAAFTGFLVTALITRSLGADQAGLFLLGFTSISVLVILSRLGLDNLLLRAFGSEGVSSSTNQILTRSLIWVLSICLPFVFMVWCFSDAIAISVFNKPDFSFVLASFIWALPVMAIFMLLGMAFQGLHRVVLATLYQNLGLSALFVLLFGLWKWLYPSHLSAQSASVIYVMCAWVVCLSAFMQWFRQPETSFALTTLWSSTQWASASNLWVVSIMQLLTQWSGILVAGALIEPAEIAYLSAAQRTAGLTSFILVVVNMVVAPRYARLWKEKGLGEIRRLAHISTRGMVVIMLPVAGVMVFFPELLMRLFGEGFEQGSVLLSIMAIGQFVNVATGSVGYLLSMSGHERDLRRVTLFSGPVTIVCAMWFTSVWGGLGAAWATALGLSLQNLGALWMVKKRLGFWTL